MGSENNFNGIYFHHYFYLKTGVSRNGLSLGYSERDTSSVDMDFIKMWLYSELYTKPLIDYHNLDKFFKISNVFVK